MFSTPKRPDRLWGPSSLLFKWNRQIISLGVKRPERGADNWPACSAKIRVSGPISLLHIRLHDVYMYIFILVFLLLLLLMSPLQPTMGFSPLGDFLPFRPFLAQFSPPSYSHRLDIFLHVFNPSFPWSTSDSPTHWLPS